MKGLDPDELEIMRLVGAGLQPTRLSPKLEGLVRRGLLTAVVVHCGALFCPGHPDVGITGLGAWLTRVVRSLEPTT